MTTIRQASRQRSSIPSWKRWLARLCLLAVVGGAVYLSPRGVLAVVGGLAIGMVVAIWWIKRKIVGALAPLAEMMETLGGTIRLEPTTDGKWYHAERMEEISAALAERGFESIGDFSCGKSGAMRVRAWLLASADVYAAAYDGEYLEPYVDLVTAYQDGSYSTYSTTAQPAILDRPPTMPLERFPELGPGELVERMLASRPDRLRVGVSAGGFVPCVQEYVAKEAAWREEQGERESRLKQELEEAFLAQVGWSAIQWDRQQHRVVFIHDGLKADDVVSAYTGGLPEMPDEDFQREHKRAEAAARREPARVAFAELVGGAPAATVFERLGELTTPVVADVYLRPEQE